MNKKVAIVLSAQMKDGGVYQYSKTLVDAVKNFLPSKFDVIYIYIGDKKDSFNKTFTKNEIYTYNRIIFKLLRKILVTIYPDFNLIAYIGNLLNPLNSILNKIHPDLVIFSAPDFNVLNFRGTFVAPIHDLMHLYEKRFPEVNDKKIFRNKDVVYKKICADASGVLVDSEYGKQQLINNYKIESERVFVLPYVAQEFNKQSNLLIEDILKKHNIKFTKYIFYPAQLWEHKNHINLINSISFAKSKGFEVNLIFCGSRKPGDSVIFESIKKNNLEDQIKYLEYVNDSELITLYKNAVALVMPTYFGPTNIPPLEAFQLGCPVLISNIYGIPEQVGDAAILFNPDSIEEIYKSIISVWNDDKLRIDLIEKGFIRTKKWNQIHFNERFLSIVNRIISAK